MVVRSIAVWLLVVIFFPCASCANPLGVPDSEYNALVTLYNSTGGDNWFRRDNWLSDSPNWYGVTVSGGHVTRLRLLSNNLTGSLPAELGSLQYLQSLSLCSNVLSGPIPPETGNLSNLLTLDLSFNDLTGSIPAELGSLAELTYLDLSINTLSGEIPPQLGDIANLQSLSLTNNSLTGQIPAQLANLTGMYLVALNNNHLTGQVPPWLGGLTNLEYLCLSWNQLTGPIPAELGQATNLLTLNLASNQLTGEIPAELGSLPNLQYLGLERNRLEGSIPPELGAITGLQQLHLGGNQLSGAIPSSIANLTHLISGSLSYNCLSASGLELIGFLAGKFPAWANTQTVQPKGISAQATIAGPVAVSWTPILYTAGSGYYEVGIATSPAGPYTFNEANRTAGKSDSSLTLVGLPDASVLYLAVRTVTLPNLNNQSILTSEMSSGVNVNLFARSLLSGDNTAVSFLDATVTAVFPDCCYAESADRVCGVRVVPNGSVVTPGRVNVTGVLQTNASGERYIDATGISLIGPGDLASVTVGNKAVGGGDWSYDPLTGAGRMGVTGGSGLNNIGLLLRAFGRVVSAGQGYVEIDDGSGPVSVDTSNLPSPPMVGSYVSVTGISSLQMTAEGRKSLVLPRCSADVFLY